MNSKRSVVIGKQALETIFPELSESEDERIRKEIIDFIQWAEDMGMTRHDYHQAKRPAVWLAYLEKQKEQKPAEWSEEDEKRLINTSISFLKDFADKGYENAVECIDWLKSIHPSWKPSEEQMKMLAMFTNLRCASRREANTLESLYNDLKKLM